MTPTISLSASTSSTPTTNGSRNHFQSDLQDENKNFHLQNNGFRSKEETAHSGSARKTQQPFDSGGFSMEVRNPQRHISTRVGRIGQTETIQGQTYPPRLTKADESPASSPSTPRGTVLSSTMMREPVAVSNIVEYRNGLTSRSSDGHGHVLTEGMPTEHGNLMTGLSTTQEPSGMALHPGRRIRSATDGSSPSLQDSMRSTISAPPPRHTQRTGIPVSATEIRSSDGGDDNAKRPSRSSSPSMIPRNPKDTSSATASPRFRVRQSQQLQHLPQQQLQPPIPRDSQSVHSQASSSIHMPPSAADWQWGQRSDPDDQEQALFEQRLCEDYYGVAVRKINQNGKSNLRYVKCCLMDMSEIEGDGGGSVRSISSRSRGAFSRLRGDRDRSLDRSETRDYDAHRNLIRKSKKKVLTWGKKKDVKLPLDRFVCVRKGKTNDRTRRNASPASRILSLITDDPQHPSLDIEAPTKLDREKFARAFARFLGIPLEGDEVQSVPSASEVAATSSREYGHQHTTGSTSQQDHLSITRSEQDVEATGKGFNPQVNPSRQQKQRVPSPVVKTELPEKRNDAALIESNRSGDRSTWVKPTAEVKTVSSSSLAQMAKEAAALDSNGMDVPDPQIASLPSSTKTPTSAGRSNNDRKSQGRSSNRSATAASRNDEDGASVVSSLSGAGYDQEIVEELHQALNELRAELEESRAEAARAVKVAEQAIQSAENSNSKDWNSTVTHKAAEAAALAQKRSAEAMAKQRLAEERLEGERRNTSFWRKQAETAEEEAGALQTRAAAAAVQREAMAEALESERRNTALIVNSLKQRFSASEEQQKEAIAKSSERNHALEIELESLKRQLTERTGEGKLFGENRVEIGSERGTPRKKLSLIGRMKKADLKDSASLKLLTENSVSSSSSFEPRMSPSGAAPPSALNLLKLYSEFSDLRNEYALMRRATVDELRSLPADAELWAQQASLAVRTSQDEIQRLRSKLAVESATRRKLLHEVQDLRGAVRVYCRPRPSSGLPSSVSMASNEVLLLHRDKASFKQDGSPATFPLSFEFDGIFSHEMEQQEVYDELEDVCLGVLDGFNICMLAYGQTGSGKTYSLLGEVNCSRVEDNDFNVTISNYGIHLRAMAQLFSVVSHRNERYQDVVTITIVEVVNERLCDLIADTGVGESRGRVIVEDGRSGSRKSSKSRRTETLHEEAGGPSRLEIKTDHNGETVVSGLVSVEISSMEDVLQLWKECFRRRTSRLSQQGVNINDHDAASHIIATIKVASTNASTGIGSTGKIQFVDLAGSDVTSKSGGAKKISTPDSILAGVGNDNEWKFTNRSMATLAEVVNARSQFARSVPYRNSTLTHLLSDSLEADTKVIMVACVSQDIKDLQATACTLRFASKMRKIVVGKATKHTLTHA